MTSHRPYRPGLSLGATIAQIETNAGRLYDPDVVKACLTMINTPGFNWSSLPRPKNTNAPIV